MPQKTIFIRDEDLEIWSAIEKKAEFVHQALNSDLSTMFKLLDTQPKESRFKPGEVVEVSNEEFEQIKHGAPIENVIDSREPTFEEQGYVYDKLANLIYDSNGEQTPGKVDKNGKIIELL